MSALVVAALMATSIATIFYVLIEGYGGEFSHEVKVKTRLENLLIRRPASVVQKTEFSHIEKLNRLLKRHSLSHQLHQLLILSGWTMPLSVFILIDMIWAWVIFFITNLISHSAPISFGVAFGAAAIPYLVLVINKKRYVERFTRNFPDALLMMKGVLKAGQGMQVAFQSVSTDGPKPVSNEFEKVVREIELGASLEDSLNELYRRIQTIDLRLFVLGILIQHEVGGNLVELFDNVEQTIRSRITISREIKILSAQGKMSGIVLMLIPIGLLCLIRVINPHFFDPMMESDAGRKMMWTAFILQIVGAIVIRKMTNFKTF